MKTKRKHWAVLALLAFIALVLAGYFLPPLAREREKPQPRIRAVNNIAPVFGAKQNTHSAPAAPTKR